jgi:hypothetical protein
MYDHGDGLQQDYAKALEWFRRAATQGDADAQVNLGVMYAKGDGVPQNYASAVKWFRKAAVQGDPDAQFYLGVLYQRGDGVPRDSVEAYAWLSIAAAQGNARAAALRDQIAARFTPPDLSRAQALSKRYGSEYAPPAPQPP